MNKLLVIIFVSSFITITYASYVSIQLGDEIVGNDSDVVYNSGGTYSGQDIVLNSNGTVIAIGGPNATISPFVTGNGLVRISEWNGSDWIKRGNDIYGDFEDDDFGSSLDLNSAGTIFAAGATGNSESYVKVFEWNGLTWNQRGQKIIGVGNDLFGDSLALSDDGNVLVIGAPHATGNTTKPGRFQAYLWNGVNWAQIGNSINGNEYLGLLGKNVCISGDGALLAVSEPGEARIRIYTIDLQNSGLNFARYITGNDINPIADLGCSSLSMNYDGTILAIGDHTAQSGYPPKNYAGVCHVIELDTNNWDQVYMRTRHGEHQNMEEAYLGTIIGQKSDRLGKSVSLSFDGNRVVVGGYGYNGGSGFVKIFEWNGSRYNNIATTYAQQSGSFYGWGSAISGDGKIFAGGAYLYDTPNDPSYAYPNKQNTGHVIIYEIESTSEIIANLQSQISLLQPSNNGGSNNETVQSNALAIIENSITISNNHSIMNSNIDDINANLSLNTHLITDNYSNLLSLIDSNSNNITQLQTDFVYGSNHVENLEQMIMNTSNILQSAIANVINLEGALANLLNMEIEARKAADNSLSNRVNIVESTSNNTPSVAQAKAMMIDLRPGSTALDISNGSANISFVLQESSDLTSNWVDRAENIDINVPTDDSAQFFRFRMN